MASKQKSGKAAKVGRQKRSPSGQNQWKRTYRNKLNRINRDRAKSGKDPLTYLAGYNIVTGIPDWKGGGTATLPSLNPNSARKAGRF